MKPGFTFVELVVGLGVATALGAVLIPTVSRAGMDKASSLATARMESRSNAIYQAGNADIAPVVFCCQGSWTGGPSFDLPCIPDVVGYECKDGPSTHCSNPVPPNPPSSQPACHWTAAKKR